MIQDWNIIHLDIYLGEYIMVTSKDHTTNLSTNVVQGALLYTNPNTRLWLYTWAVFCFSKKLHSNCSIFLQASKTLTISKISNQESIQYICLFLRLLPDVKTTSVTTAVICWWFRSRVIDCRAWARVDKASCLSVWSSTSSVFNWLFQGPIHNTCCQCQHHLLIYLICAGNRISMNKEI